MIYSVRKGELMTYSVDNKPCLEKRKEEGKEEKREKTTNIV
jgi:hypothetical protein